MKALTLTLIFVGMLATALASIAIAGTAATPSTPARSANGPPDCWVAAAQQ